MHSIRLLVKLLGKYANIHCWSVYLSENLLAIMLKRSLFNFFSLLASQHSQYRENINYGEYKKIVFHYILPHGYQPHGIRTLWLAGITWKPSNTQKDFLTEASIYLWE